MSLSSIGALGVGAIALLVALRYARRLYRYGRLTFDEEASGGGGASGEGRAAPAAMDPANSEPPSPHAPPSSDATVVAETPSPYTAARQRLVHDGAGSNGNGANGHGSGAKRAAPSVSEVQCANLVVDDSEIVD